MDEQNKIKFALYLKGWSYDSGRKAYLKEEASKITPLEFLPEMKNYVFCPECSAPLFRSPEDKDYASNGRRAFFAHARGVQTNCSLRVKQAEGKRYDNEEEAKQAISGFCEVICHKENTYSQEMSDGVYLRNYCLSG